MRPATRCFPLAALCVLLLASCGFSAKPPQALRLGLNIWPGFGPFYAADNFKLYSSTPVEITTFSSAYDSDRAFMQRRTDIIGTTLFDMFRMIDEGTPVKAIMVTDYSNGADGVIARNGITTLSQLKGKRVGVEIGSPNHFILLVALERAGLKESDITMVNLSVDESAKALEAGKLDAASLWEPFLSEQVQRGAVKLFTSKEIPGQVPAVLVVHEDVAEERAQDIANLIAGRELALAGWKAEPQKYLGNMAESLNTTSEQLQSDLGGLELVNVAQNQALFDQQNPQSLWQTYEATAQFMTAYNLLSKPVPNAPTVLDVQFVTQALSQ